MRRAGFSLLELVAVLAIFALVALIGVQAIQATVRSSDKLGEISESSGELALALAMLRQDLGAGLARKFEPPGGGARASLISENDGFSLSVGGLARLEAGASGFGRVVWRLDRGSGQVYRQVWTTLNPGGGRPVEVPVLSGVKSLELASYAVQGGWRAGYSADPRNTAALPLGLRVRIEHERAGELDVLVSLR